MVINPLQGNTQLLQGSVPQIQGGYDPQSFVGPVLQQTQQPQQPASQTAPQPVKQVVKQVVKPAPQPVTQPMPQPVPQPVQTPQQTQQTLKFGDGSVYDANGNLIQQTQPELSREQKLAYAAGMSGLSMDEYLKLISGNAGVTPEEQAGIRAGLGIDQLEQQVFTPPSKSTTQLFQDAYTTAGLGDIKTEFQKIQNKIADIENKKNQALSTISENPWLSESTRVGRVSRATQSFDTEIANLVEQGNSLMNLYNQGLSEVNNLVTMQSRDFADNQALNAKKLEYLLGKAEQQTQQLQSQKQGQLNKYLPEYLEAKIRAKKPETIGSAEMGYYQYDPLEGTFIQIIEPQMKPVSISDSSALINPMTGEVIFKGSRYGYRATSGASGGSTGSLSSYNGSLSPEAQAVLSGTLSLEDLTPTVKGRIAGELASAGYQRTANLNAGQREHIDGYDLLKREAEAAKAVLEAGLKTGLVDSTTGKIKSALGIEDEDFVQYRSSLDNMGSYLLKLRSGAAVTPQEFERIKGYIPQVNDDEKIAKTKINRFFTETEAAQKNYVKRALQTEASLQKEFSGGIDSVISAYGGVIN